MWARNLCCRMLEAWGPLATGRGWTLARDGKTGQVLNEEPLDMGLKAGVFVLKVMEQMLRLDGAEVAEQEGARELADPAELARRVEAVLPLLTQWPQERL